MSDNGVTDLAGVGKILDSEVVKEVYKDAASPAIREVGALSKDLVQTLRLFTVPFQLAAAYQDRLVDFCNRVRSTVPEEFQQSAPSNIAKPVIEAVAFTEDDSPLMPLFEELMSKAIDSREASKLNPTFPELIKSLTPLQAKLLKELTVKEQITDDLIHIENNTIDHRVYCSFDFNEYGGNEHHLMLIQDLQNKKLVNIEHKSLNEAQILYPDLILDSNHEMVRSKTKLSMLGKWFVNSCVKSDKS